MACPLPFLTLGGALLGLLLGLMIFGPLGFWVGFRTAWQDDFPAPGSSDPYAQPFQDDVREVPHA
ncbi:hypothetical protein [Ancylobacter mangrovi]|uniref:hypothetical protein n=1 Tax=Ancylobacter mangrovi TaxID=2972472 RepID=UPI00216311F9|nr:hypothetical protein [Ancylobacter mangrovi]MCS0501579.1 hypothetical protein [Ancylobacter mangrovi]